MECRSKEKLLKPNYAMSKLKLIHWIVITDPSEFKYLDKFKSQKRIIYKYVSQSDNIWFCLFVWWLIKRISYLPAVFRFHGYIWKAAFTNLYYLFAKGFTLYFTSQLTHQKHNREICLPLFSFLLLITWL